MQSRQRGETGGVELVITVAADGTLLDVSVVKEITRRLATSSVDAVRAAAPFPPFPSGLPGPTRNIRIVLNYALQGQF
jgi:TonB family protein